MQVIGKWTAARRRGFTLIELLVAIVLFTLVGGAMYKVMVNTQRVSHAQAERVMLQSNVRTGALVVPTELREVGISGAASDIVGPLAADDITYRAMRAIGFICQVTSNTELRVRTSSLHSYRDIAPVRDSLYVFVDGDVNSMSDDKWIRVAITAVDNASACGASQAIRLTTSTMATPLAALTPARVLADIKIGSPVRSYELMQLRLYQADGQSWLGALSLSTPGDVIQPVLGPLFDGNGFQLRYFDSTGTVTTNPIRVRTIEVAIRGLSSQKVRSGNGSTIPDNARDSLITRVALRNAPHR